MIHLRYVDFHDFVICAMFMVVALKSYPQHTPNILFMKFYRLKKTTQILFYFSDQDECMTATRMTFATIRKGRSLAVGRDTRSIPWMVPPVSVGLDVVYGMICKENCLHVVKKLIMYN